MKRNWYLPAASALAVHLLPGTALAAGPLPSPVMSCTDVRAYIGADSSMTMDTFKQLMIAAGNDLSGHGGAALDTQCKLTAYVKHVVMVQPVIRKDTAQISVSTEIVNDGGVCRLTKIVLTGC